MLIFLLLFVTFLHNDSCLGVTVTLTGSAGYAVLGQTFRFICTVTDEDAPTLGSVSLSNGNIATACSVTVSSCSQNGIAPGYSCGCVSGQSDVYYMNISSVSVQKDEGAWRCQRRSQASNNITLPVYFGPLNNVTQDKSSPQRVTEFSSLTVVCSSTCKPCNYTWRRGTVTVSSTKTFSLTNINRNQAGDYICTATNTKLGTTASSTLRVDVQYAPVIREFPTNYKVNESSRLQIDCSSYTTAGNPSTTSYRWTYRGSTISYVSALDISNISRNMSGQFTCTANNTAGSDSATVSVVVQYLPSITSFTLDSNTGTVTVNASVSVIMRCQVDSNSGSTIRLLNGSSELSRSDNSSFIEHTWTTDCRQRGNYTCAASNNIIIVTNSLNLIVTCSPKREVNSRQQYIAAVGDDTTLSLTILSYPEPVVSWFKTNSHRNFTSIASQSRSSDISVTASLTLTGVQQQDFGEYLVQADNGVGNAINISIYLVSNGDANFAGLIAGVVVGVSVLIAVIVISATVLYCRKKKAPADDKKVITAMETHSSNHGYENEGSEPRRFITGGDQYTVVTKRDDKIVWAELQSGKEIDGNGDVHGQRKQTDRERKLDNEPNSSAKGAVAAACCKYIDVEISSNGTRPVIKYHEEKTEYADIQPGVFGPPLQEDEEEK